MAFRIATWNINSVRLRIDSVVRFLDAEKPDVICLQEIKCRDAEFPAAAFHKLGYEHIAIHGQKSYHGVATISRLPFKDISRKYFCELEDARHLAVSIERSGLSHPLEIHNFYVPAGGDIPDPDANPKFAHKLRFLDELEEWMAKDKVARNNSILLGDLNIAPLETDVWNHKALLKVVSHTPVEVERLLKVQKSGPWTDAVRQMIPEDEKVFTWWSYRSPNWELSNRGRRLDHIWVSKKIDGLVNRIHIPKETRSWEKPSDHVPIIADLDIN